MNEEPGYIEFLYEKVLNSRDVSDPCISGAWSTGIYECLND